MDRAYPSETAGGLMTGSVPVLSASSTAREARSTLLHGAFDEPDPIWVVDANGRFAGAVPVTALFRAADSESVGSLAIRTWQSVPSDLDQEHMAAAAREARISEIAVVDPAGRFLGATPATTLLDVVWREHMEDIHRLSGILHQAKAARYALEAPLWLRLIYRLPWLVAGLIGCFVAALVVARFEAALARNLALAFFLPAIVYLADAIGTQTEAIAVRGLSTGPLPLIRSLIGETMEGAMIGSVLAILAFPAAWLIFGDPSLAFGLSVALLAAGAVAGALGMALPWAFAAAGLDPAYGSGPVGIIVQDVLSLLIYFTVMSRLIA